MAIQLGSAYGKVSLDTKGLKSGVQQGVADLGKLQKAGELLGNTMKSVGDKLTLGLTLPILALGGASIKMASDFDETKNKAVVVFGEMSDSVVSNANKAGAALGLSKTQYLDYASSLGAAFTAGGMGIKESTALAEQAVQHFADLASFHNAEVSDVAAAWQSAIRGQYEPIQRYFPFITNEYLKTYGTANGMIDANTKNLTANQRAIILNAIALDDKLNPAINDFAETSGGLANQQRIMTAQFQNALITLGQNLLPIALQVVSALNKMLEALNNLSPGQQKMLLGFLGILAVIGPLLSGLGSLITTITSISGFIGTLSGLGISFAGIGTTITATVIPAVAALGAALLPILAVLAAIALTVGIVAVAWKTNFLGMRDSMQENVKFWTVMWKAFTSFLKGDTDSTTEYLQEAWTMFVERFNSIFEKIFGIQNAWQKFTDFLRNALSKTVQFIRDSFARIDWSLIGKYILQGLASGMLGGVPALLVTATKISKDLLDTIKKNLGIASDSKEAIKLGYFTSHGFLTGMQSVSPEDMARSLTKPITNQSTSQQQTIIQQFSSGLTVSQARAMIEQNNEQLVNTMISALGGA